ncbi:MAG TPA: SAM-dependent methyltransferase [Burkholderiales bacterium]|nr:SAM-dependent methyltransferase [Burkholderiales bacterium]
MSGTLYLIPGPMGGDSLTDILPAGVIERLRQLDYFIAEHPKSARAFIKLSNPPRAIALLQIESIAADTPAAELDRLLDPVRDGKDAGLVSDAGAPAVADPGARLVARAHARGIRVAPLVGPSSILLALMASGLEGQRFAFHGYLPVDGAELATRVRELERRAKAERQTQIFIETPYRNDRLLRVLLDACAPHTMLCLATHLTLPDESVRTATIAEWRKAPPQIGKRPTVFLLLSD